MSDQETPLDVTAIPQVLKDRCQWVVWRSEPRDLSIPEGPNNKKTKIPYIASEVLAGRPVKAASNNPATWSPFDTAIAALKFDASMSGIGFCFSSEDGSTGIDLDKCFDESGNLSPTAQGIVDQFKSTYMEYSPSGRGLHILSLGKAVKAGKQLELNKDTGEGLEIYDYTSPRYFTVTGKQFGTGEIKDMQLQLDWFHVRFFNGYGKREQAEFDRLPPDIDEIKRALTYIPADGYSDWISVGMGLKAGGCDVEVWDEWSKKSPKYPGQEAVEHKWDSFEGEGITPGTIRYLAKQHGFKPNRGDHAGGSTGHLDVARLTLGFYGLGNLIFTLGRFYRWDGRIWTACEESEILSNIIRAFESMNIASKVTGSSIRSVLTVLANLDEVFKPDTIFRPRSGSICCENGELSLHDGSWQLRAHCRESYSLSMLPVAYDPTAHAPRFQQFLDEIFEGDADRPAKIKCIKQYMGYSLTTDCRFERYGICDGPGRNGKSVLLKVVENLVGEHNRSAVDPGQFDNKFHRGMLRGKLVNIVTELSEGHTLNDGSLKAFVSGEPITAEEKHKPPFVFRPYAKLWIATNHLPHTRDTSKAFFARPLIWEFNNIFEGKRCDPNLSEKLATELPGILNLVLQGLASLYAEGEFCEPESSRNAKELWHHDADQVVQFIAECCVLDPMYRSKVSEVYDRYETWAMQSGISKRVSKNTFSRRMRQLSVISKSGTGGQKMYHGVQLDRARVTHLVTDLSQIGRP